MEGRDVEWDEHVVGVIPRTRRQDFSFSNNGVIN